MQSRWFTPESAREALASLRGPAEAVSRAWRILEQKRPPTIRGDAPVDASYFVLASALRAALDAIARTGVRIGDGRRGSLDFPARRAGRHVVLCWSPGESAPAFWREAGDGPEGRRPLDDGPWDAPPGMVD
jgi:hypothetical protein